MNSQRISRSIRRRSSWWGALCALLIAAGSCGDEHGAPEVRAPSDLLRAERFSALVFELDTISGTEPSGAVREQVRVQASLLVNKPDGVALIHDELLPASQPDHAWTDDELRSFADQTENLPAQDRRARVHVVTVDGHAESDNEDFMTLGLSWGAHTIVLFGETIRRACSTGLLKTATVDEFCDECEALIWLHEFGHLLGLVDQGTPMREDHEDAEHPGHDRNPECIMHWLFHHGNAVEKLRSRVNMGALDPVGFDAQCLADLEDARAEPR